MPKQKGRPVGATDLRDLASQFEMVAGKRNAHLLHNDNRTRQYRESTSEIVEQVKVVAGACNTLSLLFQARDIGANLTN
mgnify:CR=1 FL=1